MSTPLHYGLAAALVVTAGVAVQQSAIELPSFTTQSTALAPTEPADAARLAKQATFGPTKAVVDRIVALGAEAWVDEQLAATGSSYSSFTTAEYANADCSAAPNVHLCIQTYFRAQPVAMRFYANALSKPDQLKQRVAFALSQMIVTSGLKVESTPGIASFQQIMLGNAFGNYRNILRAVTLNPAMGNYLDLADSHAPLPNQNYARELLQIFSIYPSQLNEDGTLVIEDGKTIPTYTEKDVDEIARALTGWTYARFSSTAPFHERKANYAKPMVQYPASGIYRNYFDKGAKEFLGRHVPAGATAVENLDAVIDALFQHPNLPPYISKQLIQHLVTANPSPDYVYRVTQVFKDNGQGVRGDLKAVVRAILLDPEARGSKAGHVGYGKVKEPVLYITSFMRLMGATSDGFFPFAKAQDLSQRVFEAPSVFNFYPWDFPLAQSGGMVSPASRLLGGGLNFERHNFMFNYTILDDILGTGRDYAPNPDLGSPTGTKVNWAQWEAFRTTTAPFTNVNGMLNRMDLLMLNNTMTAEQRQALKTAMLAITDGDPAAVTRRRAQTALYVILTSPQFQVDR